MLRTRIATAIIALVVLVLVMFVLPALVAELCIALLVLAAAWEWSAFLGGQSKTTRIAYIAFIMALMAAVGLTWPDGVERLLQAALVWWGAALIWAARSCFCRCTRPW